MKHNKVDPNCAECMRCMARIQEHKGTPTIDTEAWEQLYKHLGRKLHPIKWS